MKNLLLLALCIGLLIACSSPPPTITVTLSAIIIPTHTHLPTSTYTQSPSPTPRGVIGCVGTTSLNIRSGPGTQYDIIGGLTPATCVNIIALNQDTDWGWIISEKTTGWVSLYYLSIEGDLNSLPLFTELTQTPDTAILLPLPSSTSHPFPTDGLNTSTPLPSPTQSILLCSGLMNLVGQRLDCKLPVAYCSYHADEKGNPTFCYDAPYPSHNFVMVVWYNNWSDYDGRCIVITGDVTLYQDLHLGREFPEIRVSDRSQVRSCP